MAVRVGINGFGRIGRQSLKALIERTPDVEVVAVNDLVDTQMNALLFKHDSTYGAYPGTVDHTDDALIIDGREIKVLKEKDPAALPWGDLGVDIVLESTGLFTDAEKAQAHIDRRRQEGHHQRPGQGRGHHDRPRRQRGASTTRQATTSSATPRARRTAWLPAAKVVHDLLTIERGLMNTIHSYTNDQRILDVAHKDPRRARAAGLNIIPTTTRRGERASRSSSPTSRASSTASACASRRRPSASSTSPPTSRRPTSVEELNAAFRTAAEGPMKGILGVSDEPLVSTDFRGDSRSSIIDAAIDDGPRRDDGQGHQLVRQRVGLQLPRRRPDRLRRRPAARSPAAPDRRPAWTS